MKTFVVYYADHLLAVATYQADMMQSSYQTLSITSVSQGQTVPYNILDDKINIFAIIGLSSYCSFCCYLYGTRDWLRTAIHHYIAERRTLRNFALASRFLP